MRRAISVWMLMLTVAIVGGSMHPAYARAWGGAGRAQPANGNPGVGGQPLVAGADGAAAALLSALWAGRAAPAVPDLLKPWVPWVLHDNEQALCPRLLGEESVDEAVCSWPSRLRLELRDKGGGFVSVVRTYRRMVVALPGSGKH